MKFRKVINKKRRVSLETAGEILAGGEYGVLSTIGEDGFPYGVPLNYVYYNDCIYFHCAKEGHKLDNISKDDRVSFCVVTDTELMPDKFSTKYKSVIAYGTAAHVFKEEKKNALMKLVEKYSGDFLDKGIEYIEKDISKTVVVKITLYNITGKARI